MLARLKVIWSEDRGQDLIEYALLAGFVVIGAAGLSANLADPMYTIYESLLNQLNRVTGI